PEVLDELAKNEARRDELDALFNEVNELDEDEYEEDNYEVFPKEALNELKVDVKEANATIRQCKKDIKALNIRIKANAQPSLNDDVTSSAVERSQLESQLEKLQHQQTQAETKKTNIDQKLARHTELTNELKTCRATIKEIKDKKEDLVAKARENITSEEAKVLILQRFKDTLHTRVMDYVRRYERALLTELENRFTKYQHTLVNILNEREQAANQLQT